MMKLHKSMAQLFSIWKCMTEWAARQGREMASQKLCRGPQAEESLFTADKKERIKLYIAHTDIEQPSQGCVWWYSNTQ